MARLVLCVLALLVAGGLADPVKTGNQKPVDQSTLERQYKLLILFYHIHEPNHFKEHQEIEKTWNIQNNAQHYENATAVHIVSQMIQNNWNLPRNVPFSILESTHIAEAQFMFNLLFSAKDFDTFYKTAVYLRPLLNEYMYVYVLSTAIYHRHDTQGITVPPLHNVIPSFFHNSQVMTMAQRVAVHGKSLVHTEHMPSTYLWDDNIVININETLWPYITDEMRIAYFTHDVELSNVMYNYHLAYPYWIGKESCPLIKDKRGELFWWWHKQILSNYYMHRLANGLGEIPELEETIVLQGYNPGLTYMNGVPFPYRPNHFHLDSPWALELLKDIEVYETRVREAIDHGIVTDEGKVISIRSPEYIDLLGRLIEANADSPNLRYYGDFISIWKKLLGNSPVNENNVQYYNKMYPLIVPSVLEHTQTCLRDPAFYMIAKRVYKLFQLWHEALPPYTREELALPSVQIEKVDVDKLVTYFEYTHYNITNHLHFNEFEFQHGDDTKSVLVKRPRINHKVFTVRVKVNSESNKHVTVRYYLAPKYDSQGKLIPLVKNSHNFFQLHEFDYDLKQGENLITSVSTEFAGTRPETLEGYELFKKVEDALKGNGQLTWDSQQKPDRKANRLILPKGLVGGMPCVLMVHISEFKAPNVVYGTGFDPVISLGLGTGARRLTADPLGFPVDRPLHQWQVEGLKNMWFQDVLIHHKETPEIVVQHF